MNPTIHDTTIEPVETEPCEHHWQWGRLRWINSGKNPRWIHLQQERVCLFCQEREWLHVPKAESE